MASVLVVEDDPICARLLQKYITRANHRVALCCSAEEARELLDREPFDLMLVDLQLPGLSGLELLEQKQGKALPPCLVLTADRDVASAVRAMKAGALEFLSKPLTPQLVDQMLARIVEHAALRSCLVRPDQESTGDLAAQQSASPAMRQALELARRTARSDAAAVLLVGESGVGKEVMASYIHQSSHRAQGPFVRINVAAIPDSMIEAELFGTVRGSFTDAKRDREGFFAAAHKGTLLLDEIGELKPELQVKLLRAIETKRFYPVGASREVFSDVRIIAATNRDPGQAVNEGYLRADLYYRLATVVVQIPPLRERREDIEGLARALLRCMKGSGPAPRELDEQAVAALVRYPWPGNVRELRNVIERAVILSDSPLLSVESLRLAGFAVPPAAPPAVAASGLAAPKVKRSLAEVAQSAAEEAERSYIRLVLEETRHNRTRAAAILGVSRSTLWQKLRRYGLENDLLAEGGRGGV